jgi:hypothetical protein
MSFKNNYLVRKRESESMATLDTTTADQPAWEAGSKLDMHG